jgi:hypothetical protein
MAKLHDRVHPLPEFTIPLDRVSQLLWLTNQISAIMGEDCLNFEYLDGDDFTWIVDDDVVLFLRWNETRSRVDCEFSIGIAGVVPEEMKSKVDKVFDYCEKTQWVKVDRAQPGVTT